MCARRVDDTLRDAELGADQKRVGFARHADTELVGGHQAFDIKLAACVDNAGRFKRKHLEFGIVGSGHQQRVAAAQLLQNADGKRRAFGRVGTGAKFVQQG